MRIVVEVKENNFGRLGWPHLFREVLCKTPNLAHSPSLTGGPADGPTAHRTEVEKRTSLAFTALDTIIRQNQTVLAVVCPIVIFSKKI
jgi:hypothetical protein